MKLLTLEADNFGSFRHIQLSFDTPTLTVVTGATGAGKSTIMDCVSWILYGKTAKGGNVDSIRSWDNNDTPTVGKISLYVGSEMVVIYRIRGNSHENDLYWTIAGNEQKFRGKDIKETQALLESKLLLSYSAYVGCGYLSEFSPSSSFYVASRSKQKELLEGIVDLSIPIRIEEKVKIKLSQLKKDFVNIDGNILELRGNIVSTEIALADAYKASELFQNSVQFQLSTLKTKQIEAEEEYNSNRKLLEYKLRGLKEILSFIDSQIFTLNTSISSINNKCKECGSEISTSGLEALLEKRQELNDELYKNQHQYDYTAHELYVMRPNNAILEKIEILSSQPDPLRELIPGLIEKLEQLKKYLKILEFKNTKYKKEEVALETLKNVCVNARQVLTVQAIKRLEFTINSFMTKYFNSEFSVEFKVESEDLDVIINKNSHECSYYQLSKGQRAMLKLTFAVSFMGQVEDNFGVDLNVLFLDEPLDGLDVNLKISAYGLFEELSLKKSNIYIVDHSPEFQGMFADKLTVTLENNESMIA